jgi:rubrerythrin
MRGQDVSSSLLFIYPVQAGQGDFDGCSGEESMMMDKDIKDALEQAYAGEAKAALRLKIFADVAEGEGYLRIAKLFRVISFSEEIHGTRALRVLKETGNTEENLKNSFESEEKVARVAYEEFLTRAIELGDKAAAKHFSQSRDVEEGHAKLYKNALDDMMSERDTTYYVCTVCGYVSDGVLPDECPVCGVKREKFTSLD